MHNGLTFLASLELIKYLKSCLLKGSLLDNTILLMPIVY